MHFLFFFHKEFYFIKLTKKVRKFDLLLGLTIGNISCHLRKGLPFWTLQFFHPLSLSFVLVVNIYAVLAIQDGSICEAIGYFLDVILLFGFVF